MKQPPPILRRHRKLKTYKISWHKLKHKFFELITQKTGEEYLKTVKEEIQQYKEIKNTIPVGPAPKLSVSYSVRGIVFFIG